MPRKPLQDRFNQTLSKSIELVLTRFICHATTMESHFFLHLNISSKGRRECGGSITPLSAQSLDNSFLLLLLHVHFHHLYKSLSSFLRGISNLFLIIPLHLHYLRVHSAFPSVSLLSFSFSSICGGLVLSSTWLFSL